MPALPIFEQFSVSDYGLFPGTKDAPGVRVDFEPGLTLVLGANGLGKTTLVTMLYRLCTGPADIPGLASAGDLGGRSQDVRPLNRPSLRVFAARVMDDAKTASASLAMVLGGRRILVARSLQSLKLTALALDGDVLEPSEDAYQALVLSCTDVASFGDWILLLRYLTFYFEDRRALVWDATAQRQILRVLCLPAGVAAEWSQREREVLQRDSGMRNLRYALSREEASLGRSERALAQGADVHAELERLQREQQGSQPLLDDARDELVSLEAARQAGRLSALRAEQDHDSAQRDVERQELLSLEATFPSTDETALYLLAKLFSDGQCLVCGTATDRAADFRDRVAHSRCVICGSETASDGAVPITPKAIAKAQLLLERASIRLNAATENRAEAEAAYDRVLVRIQELQTRIAERSARIDDLVRRLPPEEGAVHKQRDELAALRGRLDVQRKELAEHQNGFADFIGRVSHDIVTQKDEIQRVFLRFSEGFLLESCRLAWAPERTQIGESGGAFIDFPNFELDMGGSDFTSPMRRSGPEQVSESQREFIDLAFRMTLMTVLGHDQVGSLVIDAPESSLDAVFVKRAADVLTRFAHENGDNRLVVTSNLVEGDLIPDLMRRSGILEPGDPRVVDLLDLATPTMATRELEAEYRDVQRRLFARVDARGE